MANMNERDIPSVPITTLAGVASLTVLPEMPLPMPLAQTLSTKSLLFHPRVAEEALNLLDVRGESLVPGLVQSLVQTSANHIELKDEYTSSQYLTDPHNTKIPQLLQTILEKNPNAFNGGNFPTHLVTNHIPCVSSQNWNHNSMSPMGRNVLTKYGQISPCGSRQIPQGSPAAPASATLPFLPPPVTMTNHVQFNQHDANKDMNSSDNTTDLSHVFNNDRQPAVNMYNGLYVDNMNNLNMHNMNINAMSSPHIALHHDTEGKYLNQRSNNYMVNDQTAGRFPNIRGPSPAQASDAPMSTGVYTTTPFEVKSTISNPSQEILENSIVSNINQCTENNIVNCIQPPSFTNSTIQHTTATTVSTTCFTNSTEPVSKRPEQQEQETDPNTINCLSNQPELNHKSQEEEEEISDEKMKPDSDPEFVPDEQIDNFTALQRKRPYAKVQEVPSDIPIVKPKLRKIERKFVPVIPKLSQEDLIRTNTYAQFIKEINNVLENVEDYNNEYDDLSSDLFIPQQQLNALSKEAAKLKNSGAMSSMPGQKVLRLLDVLSHNIKGGLNVLPLADPDDDDDSSEMWLNTAMERVMGATESSLITLYIMTSKEMPKNVYIEEVIDHIIQFVQYQLQNTIYPTLDPTHRIENNTVNKQKVDKRKKQHQVISAHQRKNVSLFYNKLVEIVRLVTELLNLQSLTDTTVLHLSSMSVSPFFVENVKELQLEALKLVTTIFTKYEMHRKLLLNDILASMARLPSTKRNLRSYKLDANTDIQMLTALVLQLIQCVVVLPDKLMDADSELKKQVSDVISDKKMIVDKDVYVQQKYTSAVSIGGMFLDTFLNKCRSRSEETDFRPMFENFVHDLLVTVNKPQWPAAELLLSLLGTMLIKYISNKSMDVGIRVTSLEYLGLVAARLRKDLVYSTCKVDTVDKMIADIKAEEQKEGDCESEDSKTNVVLSVEEERVQYLQSVLLDFLAVNAEQDISWTHARHFYLCQWYIDNNTEKSRIASGGTHKMHSRKQSRKKKSLREEETSDESAYSDPNEEINKMLRVSDQQMNSEVYNLIEHRKKVLLSKIQPFHDKYSGGTRVQIFKTYINYSNAELIAQYLASNRPFSKSFDKFLKNMVLVLCENSIAIRTKVMKCMSMIVEVDSKVLARSDMACSVKNSLLDPAASVREAAADLLGKFMLGQPEIIDQYYDRLTGRILDTSVAVRKRVIKILRDICIELPTYEKIPDICIKMIRRVNDEEGIRKLVVDVFQEMWFKPVHNTQEAEILTRRVSNITAVVMALKDNNNNEWFEQLLTNLFKPKEDKEDSTKLHIEPPKVLINACTQIVEYLIKTILSLEQISEDYEKEQQRSSKLAACMSTLNLFTKIRPQMLIKHAMTLEPYMIINNKCQTSNDIQIASAVASIMELTVPLMEHPSETFLARVEENIIKLIMNNSTPNMVTNCFSCLGATVNNVTHNYRLIRDFFSRCFSYLRQIRGLSTVETGLYNHPMPTFRPQLRRYLFIIGLMLRHFDFNDPVVIEGLEPDIKDQVFETLLFFMQLDDLDLQYNTLRSIGSVCVRHCDLMLKPELKSFYHRMLLGPDSPTNMRIEVLKNIELFLQEEERRMIKLNLEWHKRGKQEDLKEMCDVSSGMASTVIQDYLTQILQSLLTDNVQIRKASIQVIKLILHQGLVCPLNIVPYLICLSTDSDIMVCHTADNQLQDINKKYLGFIHMKANDGITLSYKLQSIIQHNSDQIIRGYRHTGLKGEAPVALNGFLYTLLRSTKPHRRGILMSILKQFEEKEKSLSNMLYLADNLAYFPYQVQDEPLFVIHQINLNMSLNGSSLITAFHKSLMPAHVIGGQVENPDVLNDEDEDHNVDELLQRMPEDTTHLQNLITAAQGCLLLLFLKDYLKTVYGFSDSKLIQYSPSEASKMYEKAVNRKSVSKFNPTNTIKKLKEASSQTLSLEDRKQLIEEFLFFKQKMIEQDENSEDEDKDNSKVNGLNSSMESPVKTQVPVPAQSGTAEVNMPVATALPPTIVDISSENTMVEQINTELQDPLAQDMSPNKKKVPPLRISTNRKYNTKVKLPSRSNKSSEKQKKHRQKKKRRRYMSSEDESDSSSGSDYYV